MDDPDLHYKIRADSVEVIASRFEPKMGKILSEKKWRAAFDKHGRLDISKVLIRIQGGGVHPSIREEVWEFLLGCFAADSTYVERTALRKSRREKYARLKADCQAIDSAVGSGVVVTLPRVNDNGAVVDNQQQIERDENESNFKSDSLNKREMLPRSLLSLLQQDELRIEGNAAPVLKVTEDKQTAGTYSAGVQEPQLNRSSAMRVEKTSENEETSRAANGNSAQDSKIVEWRLTLHQIGLDVVRTDRLLEFYEKPSNLAKLWDILAVYSWLDPDIGYCQGMSDLCSPMVVLFQDEADAFWCFERLMHRLRENFRCTEQAVGVQKQLANLGLVLQVIDPKLHKHLGIMAAKTLSEHGIVDFLILEATNRIGGRMHETDFSGYTIELGASWVEGVGGGEENPIWTLANKYGLRVSYSDYDNISANTYNEEGLLLPVSRTGPRFDLADASYNYSNALSTSLNLHGEEDISIATAQRLFGLIPTTPLDMAIDYFYYDFEIAEPPRVTSLENVVPNPTFTYFGDDEYVVADKRGYSYLVRQLAKDFMQHDKRSITDPRLKLQKVVTKLKYSSQGVSIETEDNSTYTAKYAILSVSLGVLKSNLIDFTPDLPYWKIKTFYQFDMSIYTKIFLKFPHKFWPTGPGTEFFLYADAKRGYYPFWQHLETEYPGSNILFVTVTDDESRRIEQQADEETKEEIMEVLKKLFGQKLPEPEEILVPRWWKNRFQGGSYTNWPIGVSAADFDRMKAPVGSLYFTGEHTIALFNGYVHGAYLAGIATAETLLDCIKKGHCDEITSDKVPWTHPNLTRADNLTAGSCKGSCCVEVQEERETLRQIYLSTIDALQDEIAAKCQPH